MAEVNTELDTRGCSVIGMSDVVETIESVVDSAKGEIVLVAPSIVAVDAEIVWEVSVMIRLVLVG